MKDLKKNFKELHMFLILLVTQTFSGLGSAMTSFALIIWSYEQEERALVSAMLMVCSYTPYVLLSIFAGAISDRWNKKKTMLVCDLIAAVSSAVVLALFSHDCLQMWHLYVINFINGFMNSVQSPASDVAITRILPRKYYQKVGGIRYISNAINKILSPVIATAFLAFTGINAVIGFDLFTFFVAFCSLIFFIRIPEDETKTSAGESMIQSAKSGLAYLKKHRGILDLMIFLSAINLLASVYESAFPAMMLSRSGGSERAMGIVTATIGVTTLIGGILASFTKEPKSRVRVICNSLLFSMSTENFLLALGRNVPVWCIGAFLGWIFIPLMSTNLEAILRLEVPVELQGRVFSARNTLQFFTIPIGYFLGGFLVDQVFEPFMAGLNANHLFIKILGDGKGSGAAALFFVIAILGTLTCLYFYRDKHIWELEKGKIED